MISGRRGFVERVSTRVLYPSSSGSPFTRTGNRQAGMALRCLGLVRRFRRKPGEAQFFAPQVKHVQRAASSLLLSRSLPGAPQCQSRRGRSLFPLREGTHVILPRALRKWWRNHLEPPYTDPYVRWCVRGRRLTAARMPIIHGYRPLAGRTRPAWCSVRSRRLRLAAGAADASHGGAAEVSKR